MIDYITTNLTKKLFGDLTFKETDLVLYKYSLRVLLCTLLNYFAFFLVGLIMGMLLENLLLIVTFSLIRKFSGGYHANKYISCFFSSITIDIICLTVVKNVYFLSTNFLTFFTLLAFICICIFSPVEHKNKRINEKEKKIFKILSITFSGMFVLISLIFIYLMSYTRIGISIMMGIILSSVLMVIGRIKLGKM